MDNASAAVDVGENMSGLHPAWIDRLSGRCGLCTIIGLFSLLGCGTTFHLGYQALVYLVLQTDTKDTISDPDGHGFNGVQNDRLTLYLLLDNSDGSEQRREAEKVVAAPPLEMNVKSYAKTENKF